MVLTDDVIATALNRIADGIEENNEVLNRIANHYDGVVPVMTRNANRAEAQGKAIDEELEKGFTQQVKEIFSPQEH